MSKVNKKSTIALSNEKSSLLSHQEEKYDPFFEWEEGPTEIKSPGRHVLSVTEEGESVVLYEPNFFEEDEAYELMDHLFSSTDWQTKNVTIRGIAYPQPRLVAWYGPFPYSYSGSTLEAAKMPDCITDIKNKVEQYLNENHIDVQLNSVLLNLYRHNKDSVSWHSDDEMSLGVCPTIASVSLGETRKFEMRRKIKPFHDGSSYIDGNKYFAHLTNGSLLIMDGSMQKDWQHRVPKDFHYKNERINLTFRKVYKVESLLSFPGIQMKMPLQRAAKKVCRRNIHVEKTVDCDTNSESAVVDSRNRDIKTIDKINRSEVEGDLRPCKVDNTTSEQIIGGNESCSYGKITLKTEDLLNEEEEQDIKLSDYRESALLNDFNDNINNVENNLQSDEILSSSSVDIVIKKEKRKSLCMEESLSVSNNSTESDKKENFRVIKNKPASSSESVEANKFITVNTLTAFSGNSTFNSYRLENLLNYDIDEMDREMFLDYALALKNRVLESIHLFRLTEKDNLELFCKLTDGTQTEENQKLITSRMYSMVHKALKKQRDSPK